MQLGPHDTPSICLPSQERKFVHGSKRMLNSLLGVNSRARLLQGADLQVAQLHWKC
jgi:hypothetical protein